MKLIVISPESNEPREQAVLAELFAAGLERYHVRKPRWSRETLAAWLEVVPSAWRSRMVLHQHRELAEVFGCGGVHFKNSEGRARLLGAPRKTDGPAVRPYLFTSRSCHNLAELDGSLGRFDAVFFSPVFPSISKVGYRPTVDLDKVAERLASRVNDEHRTVVIALGGVTPANAALCAELGFDGVAVLGALWQSSVPLEIFEQLQKAITAYAA